jgi:class 3 adenylate cyclase/tetratricopeptide (TPR) repeat protein
MVDSPATSAETRKVATILVCDLVGSTPLAEGLDPETYRWVVTSFYDQVRAVVERHDGTAQQHPGDAVVAVFGVPVLHEDDAVRAVAAASELPAALMGLNDKLVQTCGIRVQVRVGINTGEVALDERALVLGDAVNVAGRLQQVAGTGEILIGERTRELVHRVAKLHPVPGLLLKGKRSSVAAWRLLAVDADPRDRGRRLDVPLVGREEKLEELHRSYSDAVAKRSWQLKVVLGEAGVGKTRLVNEFEARVAAEATVLKGRCLQSGENFDYWPLLQVIRTAAGVRTDDPQEIAFGRLASLVRGEQTTAVRLAQMLGLHEGAGSPEMVSWAVGRLVSLLANSQPVVLVIDDLHWAKPTLLSLLQDVAEHSRKAPVLLVCMARPEFRHENPAWIGAWPDVTSQTLTPLEEGEIGELIGHLLDGGTLDPGAHRQLVGAALGNPLFAEEFVDMLREQGTLKLRDGLWALKDGELATPPTIGALLDARLESLRPEERAVLGKAAVIGQRFRADELAALAPHPPSLDASKIPDILRSLARRELVVPASAATPGFADNQFRHVLIYEAAYRSVPKETLAELHEEYAASMEQGPVADPGQVVERVARHLKAAYDHRVSLGRVGPTTDDLKRRAGERLAEAGAQAALRGDAPETAVQLLEDAVGLLPDWHPGRLHARLQLADAKRETALTSRATSQAWKDVSDVYEATIAAARRAGNRSVELHAELGRLEVSWFRDLGTLLDAEPHILEVATQEFEWLRDDVGLAKAWCVRAYVHAAMGRSTRARAAAEHAIRLAGRAEHVRLEAHGRHLLCFILDWGQAPVDEVARLVGETLEWSDHRLIQHVAMDARNVLARAEAMRGDFGRAREHLGMVSAAPRRSSQPLLWLADEMTEASVSILAGDLDRAENAAKRAYSAVKKANAVGPLPNFAALLARVRLMQGRDDEAERLAEECAAIAPATQIEAQIKQREIRAVVLARRAGTAESETERRKSQAEAERLAREAVELSHGSEQLDSQAQAMYDLAEVLGRAGRWDEAEEALQQAQELWLRKGNLVSAEKAPRLLDALRQSGPVA